MKIPTSYYYSYLATKMKIKVDHNLYKIGLQTNCSQKGLWWPHTLGSQRVRHFFLSSECLSILIMKGDVVINYRRIVW